MKNININESKGEQVEVMALFNYSQTPCQPLYFRKRGEGEIEVTSTVSQHIKFVGSSCKHIFECIAGKLNCRLEFDSTTLAWTLFEA